MVSLLQNGVLKAMENGQFSSPEGIAADSKGNVYVTDADPNNGIQVFAPSK